MLPSPTSPRASPMCRSRLIDELAGPRRGHRALRRDLAAAAATRRSPPSCCARSARPATTSAGAFDGGRARSAPASGSSPRPPTPRCTATSPGCRPGSPGGTSASRSSCTSGPGRCARGIARDRVDLRPAGRAATPTSTSSSSAARRRSTCRTSTAPCTTASTAATTATGCSCTGISPTPRVVAGVRRRARAGADAAALRAAGAVVALASTPSGAPVRRRHRSTAPLLVAVPRRHRGAAGHRPGPGPRAGGSRVRDVLGGLMAAGGRVDRLRPRRLLRDRVDRTARERRPMKLTGVELRRIEPAAGGAVPHVVRHRDRAATSCWCARSARDAEGWGECVAMAGPLYSSEYVDARRRRAAPLPRPGARRRRAASTAASVAPILRRFKGHRMAKGALETRRARRRAARRRAVRCAASSARRATAVPCGVSVGIMDSRPAAARRRRRATSTRATCGSSSRSSRAGTSSRCGRCASGSATTCCCRSTPTPPTRWPTRSSSPGSTPSTCC